MDIPDIFSSSSSESLRSYELLHEKPTQKVYVIGKNEYDEKILEKLIHSDIRQDGEKLKSMIIVSIQCNNVEAVEFFISNNCNINDICVQEEGKTAIHIAYYHDAIFVIKNLIEILPTNQITYTDDNGLTPLHIGCWINDEKFVEKCLKYHVDINAIINFDPDGSRTGFTALHFASMQSSKIVELLLTNGAAVNARDYLGRLPLHWACGCFEIADLDDSECNSIDNLDNLKIFKLLLDNDSDVNLKDQFGNTPILSIFPNNYGPVQKFSTLFPLQETMMKFKFLLERGADISLTNNEGDTVLYRAVRISYFSEYSSNKSWNLPIDEAKYVEFVETIVNTNTRIDINAQNISGKTALQLAICLANSPIVRVLLNYNARLDALILNEKDKYCFFYKNDLPTLQLVQNVINIVEMISDKGIELSLQNNLIIMKFLIHEFKNCPCENIDLSEYTYYDWDKIVNFASPDHFKHVLCEAMSILPQKKMKKANLREVKSLLSAKKIAGFFVDKETMDFVESLKIKYILDDEEMAENIGEISSMKSTNIFENITLYDVLSANPQKIYQYVRNINFCERHLKTNFPIFSNAIMGHVTKSLIRHYIENCACRYFDKLISSSLPFDCLTLIINLLSNKDIWHLCIASMN